MTLDEKLARGRRAKELLESPVFAEVMDDLVAGQIATIRNSASGAVGLREMAAAELRGLDAIRAQLANWIDDAAFDAREAERKAQAAAKRR